MLTTEGIARLEGLLDGARNVSVMAHGYSPNTLGAMAVAGELSSLERATHAHRDDGVFYLVGKLTVDDVEVTLFTEDIAVREES
jgi:hypothetical protein